MYCYKKYCKNIANHDIEIINNEKTFMRISTCSEHRTQAKELIILYREKLNKIVRKSNQKLQELKDELENKLFD